MTLHSVLHFSVKIRQMPANSQAVYQALLMMIKLGLLITNRPLTAIDLTTGNFLPAPDS